MHTVSIRCVLGTSALRAASCKNTGFLGVGALGTHDALSIGMMHTDVPSLECRAARHLYRVRNAALIEAARHFEACEARNEPAEVLTAAAAAVAAARAEVDVAEHSLKRAHKRAHGATT